MHTIFALSARNRRILALGVRGGATDEPTPIADLLTQVEGVADLNDDDLGALHELLSAGMVETLTAPVTDDDLATADQIRTALDALETTAQTRMEAAETRNTRAAELLASLATPDDGENEASTDGPEDPDEPEGDEPDPAIEVEAIPEPAEAEAEPEVLPIAASATTNPPVVTRVVARRPAAARPVQRAAATPEYMTLRASANVPGVPAGRVLESDRDVNEAWKRAIRATAGYSGGRVEIPVSTIGSEDAADIYGEDRTLRWDVQSNAEKIDALLSPAALRASGGNCAPAPQMYDQPTIGTAARPVRDSLMTRFGADRGGIRTISPPQLADVTAGITTWTQANDITPASPTTKACVRITCEDEDETLIDAIVMCATVGNFANRYFSERVRAWMDKLAQAHARVAETKLLTAIGAGSTQVAHQTVLGTARDVLAHTIQSATAMRSRFRLDPMYPFQVGYPAWLRNNMIVDLMREVPGSQAERLATSEAQIDAWLAAEHLNVTWFLDGESGQVFGAQADGAALGWPSHVVGYLFPQGQWLFLDGGGENFGIVRDSTLNATNDAQIFSETFENAHQVHVGQSLRLDFDICADGSTSLPIDISPCIAGS